MPKTFGRIAAQTAKQVIVQRIREAEREIACNEFSEKKGEILLGLVQRIDQGNRNNIMIEIGTQEAILGRDEQVPSENIRPGEKIYLYVMDVKDDARGLQIVLSRSHPGLVKRLFESMNHKVIKLKRERYAFLDLEGMQAGSYRNLTINEVKKLYNLKKSL